MGKLTPARPEDRRGQPPWLHSWGRLSLGAKMLVSYLLVIGVGVVTLILAANAVAPALFARHMDAMMAAYGPMGMPGGNPMDMGAHLAATFLGAMTEALTFAAVAATATAILLSWFVSSLVVRPVQRMLGATRSIAAGHYAERVVVPVANASDELGQLAASFNAMAAVLEQTERRRRDLIADVSHELRTPIATVEGYLEGLLDGVVEPSPQTWARLHDEAGRLRRLVDDLQELSRAEARQLSLVLRPVAPATIVQTARARVQPGFDEKRIALCANVPPDLPMVLADQDRAVQVLTNLLTNALRYTPSPGEVEVEVSRTDGAVTTRVTDNGVGFPPEQAERLFERFYRVDRARSRAAGGSGIGLTIARALVEAMGGRIGARSAGTGHGSTFWFSLPVEH